MRHIIINTGQNEVWFSVILIFTFLLVNGVFLFKSLRQKYPPESLFLTASAGMLFFVIGISLFPLSAQDLKTALSGGVPSQLGEKSIMGGLLGFIALIITIRLLKLRIHLIDNMAVVLLVAFGLQNLGCFVSGCCYGTECGLPWSVEYAASSPAFNGQLVNGLLHAGDNLSLPVHPVQLYLLIACFIAAFIVWKRQKKWKAPLSSIFFSIVLYFLGRFVVEFFRDPVTNHGTGSMFLVIKEIQWFLLLLIIIFSVAIWFREMHWKPSGLKKSVRETGIIRISLVLIGLFIINWWMRGLFDFSEKILINAFLFISLILVGWKIFKTFTLPRYRAITVISLFAACILMSQSHIPENKDEKVVYAEIGGGAQFGQFYNMVAKNIGQGTDCNGNPHYATGDWKWLKYNSSIGGLSYSITENRSKFRRFRHGMNLYFGADTENGVDTLLHKSIPIIAIQPFARFDYRWFGFGAGLHLGTFHYADVLESASSTNIGELVYDVKTKSIFPSVSVRLGPYDILYIEENFSNHFPSASPLMYTSLSLGSGLGKTDGRNISVGTSSAGQFISAKYPIHENYYASAFYGRKSSSSSDVYSSRWLFSVGLNYRFNYKTVAKKRPQPQP